MGCRSVVSFIRLLMAYVNTHPHACAACQRGACRGEEGHLLLTTIDCTSRIFGALASAPWRRYCPVMGQVASGPTSHPPGGAMTSIVSEQLAPRSHMSQKLLVMI